MKSSIPKILLVDDSSTNNLLLESALKDLHFEITSVDSGEKALKMMQKKGFDLLLLDVMMPGMSGYDLLDKMAIDEKLANIPVILVTAKSRIVEEQKAKEYGAVDYFEKPLRLDKLISRIKELIPECV